MTVRNLADVSVLIVSWNTRDLLRKCLRSVFDTSGKLGLQVIVVDNASTDGSTAMVEQEFPKVRVLQNSTNVGFARANNQALPYCSADLILLLNSDAMLIDQALNELTRFIRQHADAGAVGPKLIHPRARLRILGCGNQPTLWTVLTHFLGLSYFFRGVRLFEGIHLWTGTHDRAPRKVEWLSGACLLVRRSTIETVGPLSEKWFMYAEDWEWCSRIRRAGWNLYHVPSALVEHYLSASTEQTTDACTMSLAPMRSYFIDLNRPSRLALYIFDICRTLGFGMRAILYRLRALASTENEVSRSWRERSRVFLQLSKGALPWRQ
jgi:N-acetylglucosaminyl-diphospho-decaprenol L-rhamnosyltransferase